ncbi:hypothetical protein C0992_002328 [Termitomyces sp. T32_za158]|nr:hypothetical protein C0992_002328 [Termitomyces sp. T32_za158]
MSFSDDYKPTTTNTVPSAAQPINDTRERSQEDPSARSAVAPHPDAAGHETPTSEAISSLSPGDVAQLAQAEGVKTDTSNLPLKPSDQAEISRRDTLQDGKYKSKADLLQEAWTEGVQNDKVTHTLASGHEVEISRDRTRRSDE